MERDFKKEILALSLCLLIGFALRIYTFDKKCLWMDEIYTFNDSRDDLKGQLNFYAQNPTFLHPPLFFVLTHQFFPFTKPERDLRIIPLTFGTLSIPMIYLLARSFSPVIAIPCTLSLTFMAYHISLSQDGRSYTLLMFFAMLSLYFFIKHLKTSKTRYLFLVAAAYAILFHTSYSTIPFILFSQVLWFYRIGRNEYKFRIRSLLLLNGSLILMCLPWVIFLLFNYQGQSMTDLRTLQFPPGLWGMMEGIFHDWAPYAPLTIVSALLLVLFPLLSQNRMNAFVLQAILLLPVVGLYFYCRLLHITHFVTSRYFISFLPLFFISLYLSLHALEFKLQHLRKLVRPKLLFLIFLVASNLIILPLYYRSEKQDYKGLVTYLKGQLRDGDRIVVGNAMYINVVLHHFGIYPKSRHYVIPARRVSQDELEYNVDGIYQNVRFAVTYSKSHWFKYFNDGTRLWIVSDKANAKILRERFSPILKGYFDGSALNMERFPSDASLYLFLWDPESPGEKGIDFSFD
jgi:4-amino-4-deoxy-L-arabinose transferase-like glycosyltransferase